MLPHLETVQPPPLALGATFSGPSCFSRPASQTTEILDGFWGCSADSGLCPAIHRQCARFPPLSDSASSMPLKWDRELAAPQRQDAVAALAVQLEARNQRPGVELGDELEGGRCDSPAGTPGRRSSENGQPANAIAVPFWRKSEVSHVRTDRHT